MYPAVRELKKEFGNQLTFIVADFRLDETLRLATIYNVRYVPDFIVINSLGQIAAREGGVMAYEELQTMVLQGLAR